MTRHARRLIRIVPRAPGCTAADRAAVARVVLPPPEWSPPLLARGIARPLPPVAPTRWPPESPLEPPPTKPPPPPPALARSTAPPPPDDPLPAFAPAPPPEAPPPALARSCCPASPEDGRASTHATTSAAIARPGCGEAICFMFMFAPSLKGVAYDAVAAPSRGPSRHGRWTLHVVEAGLRRRYHEVASAAATGHPTRQSPVSARFREFARKKWRRGCPRGEFSRPVFLTLRFSGR